MSEKHWIELSDESHISLDEVGVPTAEQAELMMAFVRLLQSASADGGRKRAAGLKPSWKVDPGHTRGMFSHLGKWADGEHRDEDSGAHPLVHMAWRALALAWQETHPDHGNPLLEGL